MLIFETLKAGEETYIDSSAIVAIEDKGEAGTLVHLSGGQTIVVDAMPSKIVAKMAHAGVSDRVAPRLKSGVSS